MLTYWLLGTGFLLAGAALSLIVPVRLRAGAAISTVIIGLLLFVPHTCSQLEGYGVPGQTVSELPPRCKTALDIETPIAWAGGFAAAPGLLITIAGATLLWYTGRLCRQRRPHPTEPTPSNSE